MDLTSLKMLRRLIHEREVAHSLAENLIKIAEELHISPDRLLSKISLQLEELAEAEEVNS